MKNFCVFLLIIISSTVKCRGIIPPDLIECYTNETFRGPQLPMSFQVFIDIIRKAERFSQTSMDMRNLASSLLHRFKFDGIEFYQDIKFSEGVLPFGGTGSQRIKNQIIEELVPGNGKAFPSEALTLLERCALHRAISNTIWDHEAPATEKFCEERPTEKISTDNKLQPNGGKTCPLEQGVILTPFGTIAPGALITAVAAALQSQNVAVKLLLNISDPYDFNEDEVDFIMPRSQMTLNKSMWLSFMLSSTAELDNVWLATVAGELAEMAVYQGPLLGSQMTLGSTGFWNSTMRPRLFYLLDKDGNFEATRAEIVGAIDGFIIAKNLKSWISRFNNLRLSQILDMYYSSKGPIFNSKVRACERGKAFWYVASRTMINEQTYAASQVLAYQKSIASMTDDALKTMVHHAVNKFTNYVNNHLFTELLCLKENAHPRVEAVVVFDGAWSQDYTADFLAVLLEDLDVSMFGSRIGFLHGSTGEWILNVTNSPARAHEAISNFPFMSWPTELNLTNTFDRVDKYLSKSWEERLKNHTIGNLGQVVLLLAPRVHLNEIDLQIIILSLKKLKDNHADVNIVYYTTEENSQSFKRLRMSAEDYLITSSRINDISNYLLSIPRSLRPALCNLNVTQGVRDQFEDYIQPQQTIVYQLDPRWRRNTKKVTMTIIGVGYGTLEICSWNQMRNNVRREKYICQELSGHDEVLLTDFFRCKKNTNCPAIHYQVRGISSLNKCAEFDCRAPDHIRYLMRIENLQCSSAAKFISNLFKIPTAIVLFILITNYLT